MVSLLLSFSTRLRLRLARFYNCDFWLRLLIELFLELSITVLIAFHSVNLSLFQVLSSFTKYALDATLTVVSSAVLASFFLASTIYLCKHHRAVAKTHRTWLGKALTLDLRIKRG